MILRLALIFTFVAAACHAQAVKLQGYEIKALISGNTAIGHWAGKPYRQYFDPDGTTIYAQEGSRSARGAWRIAGDEYQSIWPADKDWQGWFVMEYAGDFYWVSKTTPPTPFRMEDGQQLIAR